MSATSIALAVVALGLDCVPYAEALVFSLIATVLAGAFAIMAATRTGRGENIPTVVLTAFASVIIAGGALATVWPM